MCTVILKKVKLNKAVGLVLNHDVTKISEGYKGPIFRRGHIIQESDIPELLARGCKHVYVLELSPEDVHEDEAALCLAKACAGLNLELEGPAEGKVNFRAKIDGFVKVNAEALEKINGVGDLIISTVHNFTRCSKGMILAGTRTVSLVISRSKIKRVEDLCQKYGPIITVLPVHECRVGVIITGDEIIEGRTQDKLMEPLQTKIENLGAKVVGKMYSPDNPHIIAETITKLKEQGCEVILAVSGMSKDPDDVTPAGIQLAGAEIECYGAPVLPGSMFLIAYLENVPILGVPACVGHDKYTILDLVLPRILVGEKVTKKDIRKLALGGLCLHCVQCNYPICPFGKG